MSWLRFLAVVFNVVGALFLSVAVITFALGAAVGGSSSGGDASAVAGLVGGVMGSVLAFGNFVAALSMFFFAGVLWGIRQIVAELQLLQSGGRRLV